MISVNSLILLTLLASPQPAELWEFTAPWCGSCREMEPEIRRLKQSGIEVRQFSVDDNQKLARQVQVTRIPAFLVVSDGKVLERRVGRTSSEELRRMWMRHQPTPEPKPPVAATVPSAGVALGQEPIERAIGATVRLRVKDRNGVSLGTGTIIDVHGDEALVLTCGHIFRDSQGEGVIMCDLFGGEGASDVPGKLVSFDARRDVGLVSLRPGIEVEPVKVGGPGCIPQKHDSVFSVGCNQGKNPSLIRNRIHAINRYHGPANIVVGGRPVDGRSGGGLFDAQGRLIGVCNAADQQSDEGLYAALGPIRSELEKAGLSYVYRPRAASIAAASTKGKSMDSPRPSMASIRTPAATQAPPVGALPASFTPTAPGSQLAKEKRYDPEVILIVRSRQHGMDKGQAYVLEQPSRALLQQLSQEMSRRGSHVPTHWQQPKSPQEPLVGAGDERWISTPEHGIP